jgi:hypothetical protein
VRERNGPDAGLRNTDRSPLEVTRALLTGHREQDWDALRNLFHPEVKVGTFAGGGAPEDPERAIEAMQRAHEDSVYTATADRISLIENDVVLLEGRVRYRVNGGGLAFVERCWLYVIVDGLLYRSAMYKSAHEARLKYETHGRTLGV